VIKPAFKKLSEPKKLPDHFGRAFAFLFGERKNGIQFKKYPIDGHFWHDPLQAKVAHYPDPDVNEAEYRTNSPLFLQRAAHDISHKIVNDPHSSTVRWLTYRYSEFYEKNIKFKSSFIEAMAKVIGILINYTSLSWGLVGKEIERGKFMGYTVPYLASQAGVSVAQFKRVTRHLRRKGVMVGKNLCDKQEDGSYKGRAALKYLTRPFYQMFGFDKWLHEERRKSQGRDQKRYEEPVAKTEKEKATVHMGRIAALQAISKSLGIDLGDDAVDMDTTPLVNR